MPFSAPGISAKYVTVDEHGPIDPHVKTAGDLNGDGVDEVVVASSAGGELVWYGGPDWQCHVIARSGRWSCEAQLVDIDGDGVYLAANDRGTYFGKVGDDPIVGDWYGDGTDEIGIHRSSNCLFAVDMDGDGVYLAANDRGTYFGSVGDQAIIGCW